MEQQIDVEDQVCRKIEDAVAVSADGPDGQAPHGAVGSPPAEEATSKAPEPPVDVVATEILADGPPQGMDARPASTNWRPLSTPKQCDEKATEAAFPRAVSESVVQTDVSTFVAEVTAADRIQAQRYMSAPEPLGERRLHFAPAVLQSAQPLDAAGRDSAEVVPDPVSKMFEEVRAELAANREQMQQLREQQDKLQQDNSRLVAERDQLKRANQELEQAVRSQAVSTGPNAVVDCNAVDEIQASPPGDWTSTKVPPRAGVRREDPPVSEAVVDPPKLQVSEQTPTSGKAPLVHISIAAPAPPQWLPTPIEHQSDSLQLQQQMLQSMSQMQDMHHKLQMRFEPPERPVGRAPAAPPVTDDEMRRQVLEMQQMMAETRSALAMQTAELAWHRQERAERQSFQRPFVASSGCVEDVPLTLNIAPGGALPSPWWSDGATAQDKHSLRNAPLPRHYTSGIDHALRKLETDHSFGLHRWANFGDRSRDGGLR